MPAVLQVCFTAGVPTKIRNGLLTLGLFLLTTAFAHECGGNPAYVGCSDPVAAGSFDLTLVAQAADGSTVPLVDGSSAPVVVGGQGSQMIVVRAQIDGVEGASCVPVGIEIRDLDGTVLASFDQGLEARPSGASLLTGEFSFVVEGWPAEVVMAVDGRTTVENHVFVNP